MRDVNSLNKVILIGRLGQNPEVRYIPQTERAVANFTLATNEKFINSSTNESEIRAEWHKIVAWGKLAEFCEKFLVQGKQILVEGKLRTRNWQDKDGNKRYTTEVHAGTITLLGKREDTASEQTLGGGQEISEFPREKSAPEIQIDDDEVPF
ncbi:MAG: single-stranded DNA-binding protein [Candidatus Aminicenantes bacterium]|nr:single-stranded DNA-binding protein [Candidatus Aminicenantes bacterium]